MIRDSARHRVSARVLVVDDEPQLRLALSRGFDLVGHEVKCVGNGGSALDVLAAGAFDLIVLDLVLPDIDGSEVLRRIREFSDVAVIVLSARATLADKLLLLGLGADDYLVKPFTIDELLARVQAVLRRSEHVSHGEATLAFGDLQVDLARHLVVLDGAPVGVTKTEYRLLAAFVTHPRAVLTHQWLLRSVWGAGFGEESEYLRTFVAQLRRKLADDAHNPRWIETLPGVGYRWLLEPDVTSAV